MNILAFFAHPDDETMLCGGALALLGQQGARVTLLCATRGEGGEMGEPPLCERAGLGNLREQELRCAGQALGLAQVRFLPYQDPVVGPDDQLFPFTQDEARLADELAQAVRETQAQAILSHGVNGEYGHPAHKLCYRAVRRALAEMQGPTPLFYTTMSAYAGHPRPGLMNVDESAHLILNCVPFREQKVQAALCHRTQHALFIRHASRELGRPATVPEVVGVEESVHRVFPPVQPGSPPQDTLAQLLRQSGHSRDNQ